MDLAKDNSVTCQVQIEHSVYERHLYRIIVSISRTESDHTAGHETYVDRHEKNNGFLEQDAKRSADVFRHQLLQVNFDFFLLCMDAPVASETAKFAGLANQDDGRVGLVQQEQSANGTAECHECRNVLSPSPAQVGLHNKASDERSAQRAIKDTGTEGSDGKTTRLVVENVGEDSRDDRERTTSEKTSEEATDENRLNILGDSDCNHEDAETSRCKNDRKPSAVQL